MRRSTALCVIACFAVTTPIHAQEAPADQRTPAASSTMTASTRAALLLELQSNATPRPASSLVASATRAASRLELQPTAAPRRGISRGRRGGLVLLGVSGLLLASGAATNNPIMFLTGLGVGAAGGVVIALTDSASPISVRDRRPDEPLHDRR